MRLFIKLFSASFTALVFVYLIAWLLNLTPSSIDYPQSNHNTVVAFIFNSLLVIAWGAWHSVTARKAFKVRLGKRIGDDLVRSAYVLMSGATLLILCLLWQPFGPTLWHFTPENGAIYWLILVDHFFGWALVAWAILSIKPLAFWGLKPYDSMSLLTVGPYRLARHPIQTGMIISVWACPTMTLGHVLFSAIITTYSIVATLRFEERDLESEFGAEYAQYQRDYRAFLPFGKRRS